MKNFMVSVASAGLLLWGCIAAKPLEYNVPVAIHSEQFDCYLAVQAEFPDIKKGTTKDPFEVVAVSVEHEGVKTGSHIVVLKAAKDSKKTGPISFNELITIEPVKAGFGAWQDQIGTIQDRKFWVFPGSQWNKEKGPHYQIRVSGPSEKALKTAAVNFALVSPEGKTGVIQQEDAVNLESRGPALANKRMVWVMNYERKGTNPILVSSEDPWGQDPKSGFKGDRRPDGGLFHIGEIQTKDLSDEGWADLAKVVQTGKARPGGELKPGGQNFVFNPAVFGRGSALYDEAWKVEDASSSWVTFKARALSDIIVHLSEKPRWMDEAGTYFILIGGFKNTKSQIRKGSRVIVEIDSEKNGDRSALITEGLPGKGLALEDFWISAEQKSKSLVISVGKGREVGKNAIMAWTDDQPNKKIQYIGFGGFDQPVYYDNITMSGDELGVHAPAGFSKIPSMVKMKAVTASLHDGHVYTYGIDIRGNLHQCDVSVPKNPVWAMCDVKDSQGKKIEGLADVSAASDGSIALVSSKKRVYAYNVAKKAWNILSNKTDKKETVVIDRIALGNANSLVGFSQESKNIYFYVGDRWHLISAGEGLDIAAGIDGTVLALNVRNEIFSFDGKVWKRIEAAEKFSMISAASKDCLYGIVQEDKKHKIYSNTKGTWNALQTPEHDDAYGLKDITIIPIEPLCEIGLGVDGFVYKRGTGEGALPLGLVVASCGSIIQEAAQKNKKIQKKTSKAQAPVRARG